MALTFNNLTAAACSFIIGLMLWLYPEFLTGGNEPWDGNLFLYALILFCAGLVYSIIADGKPGLAYWSTYLGQFIYGFVAFMASILGIDCSAGGPLFLVGALDLLVFTCLALVGALFGFAVKRRIANAGT